MSEVSPSPGRRQIPGRGTFAFLGILIAAGIFLVGLTAYRASTPAAPQRDLAKEAKEYLRTRKFGPLSGPLEKLLSEPKTFLVGTQNHALLGQAAPEFDLIDSTGIRHKLSALRESGPVVVVFYYGYYCNHCVSQLFDLNEEMARFRELGAEVVAISADAPELTQKRFARYGAFNFPVLSDPGQDVARQFGVYKPAAHGRSDSLDHATFVIDRDGVVRWAQQGDEPFASTRTLLYEVARLQDRLPKDSPK